MGTVKDSMTVTMRLSLMGKTLLVKDLVTPTVKG
jgi:hypothetical protein